MTSNEIHHLDPAKNPGYKRLYDEGNELTERYNVLLKTIREFWKSEDAKTASGISQFLDDSWERTDAFATDSSTTINEMEQFLESPDYRLSFDEQPSNDMRSWWLLHFESRMYARQASLKENLELIDRKRFELALERRHLTRLEDAELKHLTQTSDSDRKHAIQVSAGKKNYRFAMWAVGISVLLGLIGITVTVVLSSPAQHLITRIHVIVH